MFWGVHPPKVEILKSWGARYYIQSLGSSGRHWGLNSLLTARHCVGWGLWPVCLSPSYPFWFEYFLIHPMCRSHSADFWIFWWNFSTRHYRFAVFVGEGEFRSLLYLHLGLVFWVLFWFGLVFWFFGHLACRILVPRPGVEPAPAAVEVQSLNHWTTREVPVPECFKYSQSYCIKFHQCGVYYKISTLKTPRIHNCLIC